ncbi:expressed unknown protein [Seminavis robusta]|uniref:Amidohydrolase-related domain-containing protein n=1 Tax=Seminavis robusta TaxID=568900 RepID=A0A9N8E929_9STRA|nr:expressed unknown protein [Seminavis robusta]|eukprot:Sro682_g186540.1 n/a (432) ;mRNA; f:42105-43400
MYFISYILLSVALMARTSMGQPPEAFMHGEGSSMGGGPPPGAFMNAHEPQAVDLSLVKEEFDRCNSEIIDVHLHDAFWFNSADPLLEEMKLSHVSRGLMLSVYGPIANPFSGDPNEVTESIVNGSNGRIFGLASLNTTIPDWENHGEQELERLATFLAKKPGFVGGKVAAPHTCLPLNSDIMRDVVRTISESPSPVVFLHIGTTPFCGPMGEQVFGRPACCGPEFVDPTYLEDLIQKFTDTTFILVHAGADFLPPNSEHFYHGENVDKSVMLAETYDNVYLEISAFLRQGPNGTDVYTEGTHILDKIADAGLASKTIYGSDVNHAPHAIGSYLATTLDKFIAAGFDEEERCMMFSGNAIKAFGLELGETEAPQPPMDSEEHGEEDNGNHVEEASGLDDVADYLSSSGAGMFMTNVASNIAMALAPFAFVLF